MQGGAPNSMNPYGGYQASAGAGGQQPQSQQPQQAGAQGYGQGSYYPQQQQQYGGYQSQAYGQGYAPRGGYQQPQQQAQQAQQPQQQAQQPQQSGYAPRGGYYQAAGGYGSGAQQSYSQGAYGQSYAQGGYYPQQQQQQGYSNQGYNNQGYNANYQYGQMARGGFQGGAYQGGGGGYRGQQPYNPQQQQQFRGGFRGGRGGGDFQRGGRGGGRGMARGGRGGHMGGRINETFAVVHLDSYAQLEEAGRKGATEEMVPADVLTAIRARSHGGPIRLLVVIAHKYAAACMSLPRHSDDTLLSEKTAEAFMQVPCATANHANRLVDVANGGYIQGAVYGIFRSLMVVLTPFDKPQTAPAEDAAPLDLNAKTAEELLEGLTKEVATYEALLTAMSADSEESTKLFARLMRLDAAEEAGEGEKEHEEGDDDHNDEGEDGEENKESEKPAGAAPEKPRHTLMSSPQGIRVLHAALAVSSKRRVFFEKLAPPPPKEDGADALGRLEWSTSLRLLNPLFQYPLLSDLTFQFFGVAPTGASDVKVTKPKAAELKTLCDAIVRYGVFLSSSAACGNTILSLLHAMDPQAAKASAVEQAAEEAVRRPGLKRGRDAEETAEAGADDGAPKAKVEGADSAAEEGKTTEQAHAPASLADYKAPSAPADWHLYYALAESWCTGELPTFRRKRTRFTTEAQLAADAAAAAKPATVESRLQHVSRNVTGSFLVRYMMPIFCDAILAALKSPASRKKKEHDTFVHNCETLVSTMAASWTTTDPTYTDGYIYRSLLTTFAARAVPGTPVEAALRTLNERIVNTIFEASREKYHSHCVQEALTVARQTKDGGQFILQVARALMEKGDDALISLAVSPSGNYVVRHLCGQLTDYATGKVSGAEPEVVEEAKELEGKYYAFMSANLAKLSGIAYGRGLVGWQGEQASRLAQASASAAPAAPAAPAESAAPVA